MPTPRDSRRLLRGVVPRPARAVLNASARRLTELQQQTFERRLGVRTAGHAYLEEGLASERFFYEGCEWLPVRRALRALSPGPDDVFVDLGSGRGQGLLIAGLLPYGRVLGVELGEDLHRETVHNLERARPRLKAQHVESINADVLDWPIPDDLTTVFMYSPFIGELFQATMQRLFDSYDRCPRTLRIVYDFPWEHDWLVQTGRVVVENVTPAQWPAMPWWWRSSWAIVTYRVVGEGEGGPGAPTWLPRRLFRPQRAVQRWSGPNRNRFKLIRPGEEPLYSRPED